MANRGQQRVDAARSLAEDLADQGEHRAAQVIRDLCRTYETSRSTNRQLHADNMALRAQSKDNPHA
jgi:hypothetical protein